MNKKLVLMATMPILLISCNSKNQSISGKGANETIALTCENFNDYVATNTLMSAGGAHSGLIINVYFIGADNCKFIDCKVSYCYYWSGNSSTILNDSQNTIKLTISGDGETVPFVYSVASGYAIFKLTGVTGTIEIYK